MNLKPLIDIIRRQQTIHEKILVAKRDEKRWIALGDSNKLLETAQRLDDLADEATVIENERQRRTQAIAQSLGLEGDITLKQLLDALPPANRPELEGVGAELREIVFAVRDANQANQLMLRRAIDTLNDDILDMAKADERELYGRNGNKQKPGAARMGLNVKA